VQAPSLRTTLGTQVHVAPYLGSYFYGYNLTRAPFAGQAALRRALSMVVDRELIASKLLNGLAVASNHLVPPGIAGYQVQQPEWVAWPLARRVSEAQRLLAVAGYTEARPLEVEIRYNTQDDNKRIAVVIAAMWKQRLAVRARLVNEEWKVFLQNRRARRVTQAFRNTWIADFDDPVGFLDLFRRAHPRNDSGYDNPAYDAALDVAAAESDAGRRATQLEAAERTLLDDAAILPIYTYTSKHLVSPRVLGWQDNRLDWHYTKDLRLDAH
jgi:oligopeptide transport system substrate-binding protein